MTGTVFLLLNGLTWATYWLVGVCGVVGAVLALMTREDAFRAGDRMTKMSWVALLAASSAVLIMPISTMLTWIGAVVIGVYWFDVRPQLRDIISGNTQW